MPNYAYEGFHEAVMISEDAPLSGQKNRSSKNYNFNKESFRDCDNLRILIEGTGQDNIIFDIKRDHTAAKDDVLNKEVKNNDIIANPKGNGIYIANPKHASGQFKIRVIAL